MSGGVDELPRVSVLMPVRDEVRHIDAAIAAVLAQDYPADRLELIVADGGSSDGTTERVRLAAARDARVQLLDNPARIAATGLNRALDRARGEVVVRMDAHATMPSDYVRQCVLELRRSGADNVGGRVVSVGEGATGEAIALAMSSPFGVGDARFRWSDEEAWVETVPFGAWRRELFERVGRFDEALVRNQDYEHNCRIRRGGGRILLTPRVRSTYFVRGALSSLGAQYFRSGWWKVPVLQRHARQMRPRHFAPPVLVAALTAAAALAATPAPGAWPLVLLGGGYAAACLVAAAGVVRRRGAPPTRVARVALAFAVMHLAYGAGFLLGLVRFAVGWIAALRPARPPTCPVTHVAP